jgi:uncharacterized protein (TIGR03083 family)
MEISEHIGALDVQGRRMAAAAASAGLDAVVPSCPAWRVRDLLRHTGYVHRWAAGYVAGQLTEMVPELTEAEQLSGGAPDSELLDWFLDGHGTLVAALRSADPGMSAWTFLAAPSALAFWARRQSHETAIHCADAELAAGSGHDLPAEFAADGVDELLIGFFGRDAAGAGEAGPSPASATGGTGGDATRLLLVRAADTGHDWHARLDPGGSRVISTGRGHGPAGVPAACAVTGPATALYLLLWNRSGLTPDVEVAGDAALLSSWRASMHVTWA